MTLTLSAQQNRTGSVELTEVEDNGNILTFLVEGISEKKADVLVSAKETLIYKLLYEGVEGVNDGNKLIEHENKYWLTQFFAGKNAPYNAYLQKVVLEGVVQKDGTEFHGNHILVLNYKALLNALKVNGIVNHSEAVARVPKTQAQAVGLQAIKEKEEAAARARAEAEAKAKAEAEAKAAAAAAAKAQQAAEAKAAAEARAKAEAAGILFSKSGVGPLKLSANYEKTKLPASYKGLYDSVEYDRNQFDGALEIRCLKEDVATLLAMGDESDKVVSFAVTSSVCKTAEGLSVANTADEILAAGATNKSWKLVDGNYVTWHYCLYLNGVYFLFKSADGANGKPNASAKPIALSNVKHAILDLEFLE